MTLEIINENVGLYNRRFPEEATKLSPFLEYLAVPQPSLFDRKNFNGHITASAFILNEQKSALLLIRHKALQRWLQPGGHVDGSDQDLIAAALREAIEETGLTADNLLYLPLDRSNRHFPFDIDPHWIPENAKKQEPGHYHHDHRFVFVDNGRGSLHHSLEETEGIKWVSFDELKGDEVFGGVVLKLRQIGI